MFEPPARAEPTENSEENSETSTSDGDDESRLLNTIWSVVILKKGRESHFIGYLLSLFVQNIFNTQLRSTVKAINKNMGKFL